MYYLYLRSRKNTNRNLQTHFRPVWGVWGLRKVPCQRHRFFWPLPATFLIILQGELLLLRPISSFLPYSFIPLPYTVIVEKKAANPIDTSDWETCTLTNFRMVSKPTSKKNLCLEFTHTFNLYRVFLTIWGFPKFYFVSFQFL